MNDLYDYIESRLPIIKLNFGSTNSFINYVSTRYSTPKLNSYLYDLISFPGNINVVNPTFFKLKLYQRASTFSESVVFEEPYKVLNREGELLYKVSGHEGVFGNSILDRSLIINSQPSDFYYLQYSTYSGLKTTLIMVTTVQLQNSKKISPEVDSLASKKQSVVNDVNQVVFKLVNGYKDFTKPTLPWYPLYMYFLKSPPTRLVDYNSIVSNVRTEATFIEINSDNTFPFYPTASGWLVLAQKTPQLQPLKVSTINGIGVDRFVDAADYVSYVAVSKDIDIDLLRQSLDLISRVPRPLTTTAVNASLNVNIDLSI